MRLRPWLSPQVLISSETSLGITDDALRRGGERASAADTAVAHEPGIISRGETRFISHHL